MFEWKKTSTHLLSLLYKAFQRMERENFPIANQYTHINERDRHIAKSVRLYQQQRRRRRRHACEMCTMTSLLNEKFHHIIKCVYTVHAKLIEFHYIQSGCVYCTKGFEAHFSHGERVNMINDPIGSSLSLCVLRKRAAPLFLSLLLSFLLLCVGILFSSLFLFLCNRCVLFCWSLRGTSVYSEAEHAVDVAVALLLALVCLFALCVLCVCFGICFYFLIRLFRNI